MQNANHGRKVILTAALLLLFAGGLTAGYLYLSQGTKQQTQKPTAAQVEQEVQGSTVLKIYYPVNGYLQMEERVVTPMILTREDAARATVQAYLRGPAGMLDPAIPPDVNLLGTYFSPDGVLFIDLSDAFRRNFQGDALTEYLLLRGLYESILSNVSGIKDVRLLIEGKEIETVGGHMLANVPLGQELIINTPQAGATNSPGAMGISNSPQTTGVANGTPGK